MNMLILRMFDAAQMKKQRSRPESGYVSVQPSFFAWRSVDSQLQVDSEDAEQTARMRRLI